jgi:hypothetical protein
MHALKENYAKTAIEKIKKFALISAHFFSRIFSLSYHESGNLSLNGALIFREAWSPVVTPNASLSRAGRSILSTGRRSSSGICFHEGKYRNRFRVC